MAWQWVYRWVLIYVAYVNLLNLRNHNFWLIERIAPNAKVTEDTSLQLIKEKVASERKLDETLVATEKTEKSLSLKIASLEAQLAEAKNE